jgi:hypothetical protein
MNGRRSRTLRKHVALAMTAKPGALALAVMPHTAAAATVTVACDPAALVTAINNANAAVGSSTLSLASGCVYDLLTANTPGDGLPVIANIITIQGNGATITRDNAAPNFRILEVGGNGNLTMDHVTISHGKATTGSGPVVAGGGIFNAGTLTLSNSTISSNSASGSFAAKGGGIWNSGTATITDSAISGNTTSWSGGGGPGSAAAGGGIETTAGTLTVRNSTISGNLASATGTSPGASASARGGGIAIRASTGSSVAITGSTINGNSASASAGIEGTASATGAGIDDQNVSDGETTAVMTVKLANDTITGNALIGGGPAGAGLDMSSQTGDTLTVINSTFANDGIKQAGAGIATLTNSILSTIANGLPPNCSGTIADGGHNISFPASDTSCGTFGQGNPMLVALANNGGLTQTMALGTGSAAIDAAAGSACQAALPGGAGGIDQRGLPRAEVAADATCDIGAFEVQPLPVAAVAPVAQPALPKAGRPAMGGGQEAQELPLAPIGSAAVAASLLGLGLRRRRHLES